LKSLEHLYNTNAFQVAHHLPPCGAFLSKGHFQIQDYLQSSLNQIKPSQNYKYQKYKYTRGIQGTEEQKQHHRRQTRRWERKEKKRKEGKKHCKTKQIHSFK
jgi:hypothetical protein